MLCEKCQQRESMVHLSGGRRIYPTSGQASANESFEHHFCELCAQSSPLVNPSLAYGPDAVTEKLRVISVSGERTVVRLVRTETQSTPEDWSLLTSRLRPQYGVVGMEFQVTCSPAELKRLQGTNGDDDHVG